MIIRERGLLFIHIPKSAGTAVEVHLRALATSGADSTSRPAVGSRDLPSWAQPDYEALIGWCPDRKLWMQHATPQELVDSDLLTRREIQDLFVFSITRNPFDRAVSDFYFLRRRLGVFATFSDMISQRGSWRRELIDRSDHGYRGDHFRAQQEFMKVDGVPVMSHVGRFEDLTQTWDTLSEFLGVRIESPRPANVGNSPFRHYSHFYSNREVRLVEHQYHGDLADFDYHFEDRRTAATRLTRPVKRIKAPLERVQTSVTRRAGAIRHPNHPDSAR